MKAIGPGSHVLLCPDDDPGLQGLVLKRQAPKGWVWVRWPWMPYPTCEIAAHLTRTR